MPVLGERIRQSRLAQRMGQSELADLLNERLKNDPVPSKAKQGKITQRNISNWELSVNMPHIHTLTHIAAIVKRPIDYLLGLTDDPNSRLEEAGLSEQEKELVRIIRRFPDLQAFFYSRLPSKT